MLFQVNADWQREGTAAELEEDIGNGFEFKGPGFYLRDHETDLITPCQRCSGGTYGMGIWTKASLWPDDARFIFYHWDCPLSDLIFSQIGSIPTRTDERT